MNTQKNWAIGLAALGVASAMLKEIDQERKELARYAMQAAKTTLGQSFSIDNGGRAM